MNECLIDYLYYIIPMVICNHKYLNLSLNLVILQHTQQSRHHNFVLFAGPHAGGPLGHTFSDGPVTILIL